MKTLTRFINPVFEESVDAAKYEVVENEIIKSSILEDLTISGSLFSLTTFTGVTFKSCVFFGSRMENCNFVGCKFIDCKFEFSHISHCNMQSVEFENCEWEFSSISKTSINHGKVDAKTMFYISKGQNTSENILCPLPESWDEAQMLLLETEQRQEACDSPKEWGKTLVNFFKAA